MKVNILNLSEEGLSLQFSFAERSFSDLIAEKEKLDFSLHQVDINAIVRKVHQNIFFTGTLETILETQCSRCLEMVQMPLQTTFSYTLLPEVAIGKEEIELRIEDIDVGYYGGEVIDLDPIVFEQIILQIPMKVLCSEVCKGLCPHCGINLNMESCDCRRNLIDERLSVLKNFKV